MADKSKELLQIMAGVIKGHGFYPPEHPSLTRQTKAAAEILGQLFGKKKELMLAVAEDGSAVVPLLGGHHGANDLARRLAELLGCAAAVTTAGDRRFGVALDRPPLTGRQLLDLKSLISGIEADLDQYELLIGMFERGWAALGSSLDRSAGPPPIRVLMTGVPMVHGAERDSIPDSLCQFAHGLQRSRQTRGDDGSARPPEAHRIRRSGPCDAHRPSGRHQRRQ